MFPLIEFGGWQIRGWVPEDAAWLARHADNPRIADQLRDRFPHPYTVRHAREWIEFARRQHPETFFAIATETEAIGGIGLELQRDVHCKTAELGYWIAEPYWGRGIATAAVRAFSEHALRHYDLIRVYACVFETNPASVRVLQKAGFRFEGRLRMSAVKQGKVLDQLMYSLLRAEALAGWNDGT